MLGGIGWDLGGELWESGIGWDLGGSRELNWVGEVGGELGGVHWSRVGWVGWSRVGGVGWSRVAG